MVILKEPDCHSAGPVLLGPNIFVRGGGEKVQCQHHTADSFIQHQGKTYILSSAQAFQSVDIMWLLLIGYV